MKRLPTYKTLVSNFPNKHDVPTKQLLDKIGGEVRSHLDDGVNTCCIRLSYAMNHSGAPIEAVSGLYILKGAGSKPQARPPVQHNHNLYIIRVLDMKRYLASNYGGGRLIYSALKDGKSVIGVGAGTKGIILFQWNGPYAQFGAFGHVDLINFSEVSPSELLPQCEDACYWQPTKMPMEAFLWQLVP
jgi:hypothetical protein